MSAIMISNIRVKNPKDYFMSTIDIELDLKVFQTVSRPFQLKVVYVGSPDDPHQDQVIELANFSPLPLGRSSFFVFSL